MNLSERDSDDMWNAIRTHNLKSFYQINKKIIPPRKKFQKLPVKIYIPGSSTIVQAPIHPYLEDGEPVPFKNILEKYIPDLMRDSDGKVGKIYIHGVNVDSLFDNDMIDVWELFKHLDNFLYIVVLFGTYSSI